MRNPALRPDSALKGNRNKRDKQTSPHSPTFGPTISKRHPETPLWGRTGGVQKVYGLHGEEGTEDTLCQLHIPCGLNHLQGAAKSRSSNKDVCKGGT